MTKPTGYFDDMRDFLSHNKFVNPDHEASSITRDPLSLAKQINTSVPTRKTFFTSTHIQMIERSPKEGKDKKSKTHK